MNQTWKPRIWKGWKTEGTVSVDRRNSLCLNFALKSAAHPKQSKWFQETSAGPDTINQKWKVQRHPVTFMTELLNNYYRNKK